MSTIETDSTMTRRILLPFVALAVGALTLVGCDSFLEPEPESFQTGSTFYSTPDQIGQAVNGAYTQLRGLFGSEQYRFLAERRGPTLTKDFDVNLPRTVGGSPQTDEWTMTVDNDQSEVLWQLTYDLVKETNVILDQIEGVEFQDQARKARLRGEALTMRALAYWFAAQAWGDVPLILEPAQGPSEAIPDGRAPRQEVYSQVISDLTSVVENGALPVSYSGDDVGRITDGAARFLLGRTYLLTEEYENALTQFEALDDGRYQLLDDHRQIFNPSNKNNEETILELQYDPSITGQGSWGVYNQILPITATKEDLIPSASSGFIPQGNIMPTPDIIQTFEGGDERVDAYLAWHEDPENRNSPEIAWPVRTPTRAPGDSVAYLYKYYWPGQVDSQGNGLNNWVMFRFADVLLSAAEAHWRLGQNTQAQEYLNRVRNRAGLDDYDPAEFSSFLTSGATGDPLGDAILHERAVELLGEGHFWFDLKRFGPDVARKVFEPYAARYRERDPRASADDFVFQEYKLLYPVPTREIDLAGLSQNSGW